MEEMEPRMLSVYKDEYVAELKAPAEEKTYDYIPHLSKE